MIAGCRYTHTSVVARDWRALAAFYGSLFGCKVVGPERDYAGAELQAGTGVAGAALAGAHLRLPGLGPEAPTLEIFQYTPTIDGAPPAINRPGLAHLAFAVDSVSDARAEVLSAGGSAVGEIMRLTTATGAVVTACYVTDPEGNIIELQSWA
jgi:predicted enzyme related to lactoylglutathione lyase